MAPHWWNIPLVSHGLGIRIRGIGAQARQGTAALECVAGAGFNAAAAGFAQVFIVNRRRIDIYNLVRETQIEGGAFQFPLLSGITRAQPGCFRAFLFQAAGRILQIQLQVLDTAKRGVVIGKQRQFTVQQIGQVQRGQGLGILTSSWNTARRLSRPISMFS
nr:hypothetical protein [Massilia sp. NR 4-1]